jgi:hypothetical protein
MLVTEAGAVLVTPSTLELIE